MEKSCNSSMMKDDPSKQATNSCTQEESGWTAYFEDFSNNNNYREEAEEAEQSLCLSLGCTSSLVSDAGTGAAWRKLDSHNNQNLPKKLSFKKTRTKKISGDDLEDTASSPVNSPKIGDFRPAGTNPRRIDDDHHMNMNSLGKEGTSHGDHFADFNEHAHDGKIRDCCGKNDTSDLKKKGLCLVPMSLLVNYLV